MATTTIRRYKISAYTDRAYRAARRTNNLVRFLGYVRIPHVQGQPNRIADARAAAIARWPEIERSLLIVNVADRD